MSAFFSFAPFIIHCPIRQEGWTKKKSQRDGFLSLEQNRMELGVFIWENNGHFHHALSFISLPSLPPLFCLLLTEGKLVLWSQCSHSGEITQKFLKENPDWVPVLWYTYLKSKSFGIIPSFYFTSIFYFHFLFCSSFSLRHEGFLSVGLVGSLKDFLWKMGELGCQPALQLPPDTAEEPLVVQPARPSSWVMQSLKSKQSPANCCVRRL